MNNEELLKYLNINLYYILYYAARYRRMGECNCAYSLYCPFNLRSKKSIFWKYLYHRLLDYFYYLCSNMKWDICDGLIWFFIWNAASIVKLMERIRKNFYKIENIISGQGQFFFSCRPASHILDIFASKERNVSITQIILVLSIEFQL